MKAMELMFEQDRYIKTIMKWTLFIILLLSAITINTLQQQQLKTLVINSKLLKQKSILVSQMHDEMLTISRTQLQIIQASSEQQIKEKLRYLSILINDYLFHYYQFKDMSDESDAELLVQLKSGFEQWHEFNEDLLTYANVIADSGFINTLNMVDFAISQLDIDAGETTLVITQLE